jgi:DUF438 domain-containing protein
MTDKEQLKLILKGLKTQGDSKRVKLEAAEFLRRVDARTLSIAEQELIEEGAVTQDELRGLCGLHLQVLGANLEQQKSKPEASHPVGIFMAEHEVVLLNLNELRKELAKAKEAKSFRSIETRIGHLRKIARLLLDSESHHRREEEALFPRLEKHGITGPPRIMRLEHDELRAAKRKFAELVEHLERRGFTEFVSELCTVGNFIADYLTDHIFKEDNILYPTALQTLEPQEWEEVKRDFERIGYCSFTPGKEQ